MAKTRFTFADDLFRGALRDARRAKGLSQAELGARLRVPQSYVSKYENGERSLNFVEAMLVSDALEIDFVDFSREFLRRLREGKGTTRKRKASR